MSSTHRGRREFFATMLGFAVVVSGCEDTTGEDDDDDHASVDVLNSTGLSLVNVVCTYNGGSISLATLSVGGIGHFTGIPPGPITVTAAAQASLSTTFRATGTGQPGEVLVLTLR
jgi:hypothetical protein